MRLNALPSPGSPNRFVSEAQGAAVNMSGLEPIGTKVLVLTDQIAGQSSGGIHIPETKVEELTLAVTKGALVAIGGAAFTDWPNTDRAWPGRIPQLGARVSIAKYAGIIVDGKDGKKYRLIQDTEVSGMEV